MGEIDSIVDQASLLGYCFLPRAFLQEGSEDVIDYLGKPYISPRGKVYDRLQPTGLSREDKLTYSSAFNFGDFPLHTDLAFEPLPARYVVLQCINGAAGVCTRVVDTQPAIHSIGRLNAARTLMLPRHRIRGQSKLRSLLTNEIDSSCVRWDMLFYKPANKMARCLVPAFDGSGRE